MITQLEQKSQVSNPFHSLYQQSDSGISDADHITSILEFALNVEKELYSPDQIDYLESQIKTEQLSYVRLGLYYFEVLRRKLYLDKYQTFRDWCEHEVGRSTWAVKNHITAADITLTLITNGFEKLPHNISQCLALHKSDNVVMAWRDVLESIDYFEITADRITNLLFPPQATEFESKTCNIHLTPKIYERLTIGAIQAKMSISDYITDIYRKCEFLSLILMRVKWQT